MSLSSVSPPMRPSKYAYSQRPPNQQVRARPHQTYEFQAQLRESQSLLVLAGHSRKQLVDAHSRHAQYATIHRQRDLSREWGCNRGSQRSQSRTRENAYADRDTMVNERSMSREYNRTIEVKSSYNPVKASRLAEGANPFAQEAYVDSEQLISARKTDADFITQRAQENLSKLAKFKREAGDILEEVQGKLDQLAGLVRQNVNQGSNMEGYLLGKINEYAVRVDREDFDLRVDLDAELWEAQIKNAVETQAQAERISNYMQNCKTGLTEILRPQGLMPNAQYSALKRFTFGEQIPLERCTFEWPTLQDLKKLSLKKLPVLKEIRLRQTYTSCIGSVQLVFEGGLCSPLFEGIDKSEPLELMRLTDPQSCIKELTMRVWGSGKDSYLHQLILLHQNAKMSVSHQFHSAGELEVFTVPQNHVILGVYGKIADRRITTLGFSLINASVFQMQ